MGQQNARSINSSSQYHARAGNLSRMSDDVSDEELDAIERRAQAATRGPWKSFVEGRDHWSGDNFIRTGGLDDDSPDMYVTLYYGAEKVPAPPADLDLIAHSRQDVLRLVAEVRRLRASDANA
jgi:hypothetical protein